uniref:RING-type domain-containing protein n=1 Tax=Aegilops tauschii subsp. strangulata TaxID=200361 RepID=A0A453CWB2_AEGTS
MMYMCFYLSIHWMIMLKRIYILTNFSNNETVFFPEKVTYVYWHSNFYFTQRRQKSGQVKGDIQKVMDEVRSIKEILKDAKQCPRCKMAISKIEGCNKMTCWNCGRFFCYQCNAAISGYDHFKGDCVVFDQEEIDRWEMQMNQRQQRQVVAQAQAEIFEGEYGYPCPTCRNPIPKIGNNNHLYCWACQRHFCALCRKVVLKTSQHFGPRGCKQHTADD